VTFVAIRFGRGAESFFAVMAGAAKFTLFERGLGYFAFALFHLENFRVTIGAFRLVLVHV
jgi:hypothetical protein